LIYRDDGKVKTRANWHPSCLEEYKVIYWPGYSRKAVFRRDRGVCCDCGMDCQTTGHAWEMDHDRPLFEANGDISFWKLPNLKTRCGDCHSLKTAAEAAQRAAERKAGTRAPVKRKKS
jgi:5-methylcytosine-specific restriction endonuclease McrA